MAATLESSRALITMWTSLLSAHVSILVNPKRRIGWPWTEDYLINLMTGFNSGLPVTPRKQCHLLLVKPWANLDVVAQLAKNQFIRFTITVFHLGTRGMQFLTNGLFWSPKICFRTKFAIGKFLLLDRGQKVSHDKKLERVQVSTVARISGNQLVQILHMYLRWTRTFHGIFKKRLNIPSDEIVNRMLLPTTSPDSCIGSVPKDV